MEVYPVLQYSDLTDFFQKANITDGDYMKLPFKINARDENGANESKEGKIEFETEVQDVLRSLDISKEELEDYIKSNKEKMKPNM